MLQGQLFRIKRVTDSAAGISARSAIALFAMVARRKTFFLAVLATLLFYLPSLQNSSVNAGFLYSGDVMGFYWPSLAKAHALMSNWHFTGIDFSLFNGSSDFFLTSNFFGVHPFFVIYSLLTSSQATTLRDVAQAMVVALALHSFISCYFSIKLLSEFFDIPFLPASFAAIGFAFSLFVMNALCEPQFVFCAASLAWGAYAALDFERNRTASRLLIAVMPVLLGFLGGYIPIGVACLALSVVLVAVKVFLFSDATVTIEQRVRRFIVAMLPFCVASLISAPYLLGAYQFLVDSPSSKMASVFFSAHQLADLPQAILRLVSFRLEQPGPFYEGSVTWGLIAVSIVVLFILDKNRVLALSEAEWKLLKVSSVIYFITVLATFGAYSVVSDLVFYLVPQVGKMHIYQRFLLPAHLMFCLMVILMLKSVMQNRHTLPVGAMALVYAVATLAAAYIVARHQELAKNIGLNNHLVFELLLAFLFALVLLFPGDRFIYIVTIVLFTLPALDRIYDYSVMGARLEDQRKVQPRRNSGSLAQGEEQRSFGVALPDAQPNGFGGCGQVCLRRKTELDVVAHVVEEPRQLLADGRGIPGEPGRRVPHQRIVEVRQQARDGSTCLAHFRRPD
jgi:hypothetical protein